MSECSSSNAANIDNFYSFLDEDFDSILETLTDGELRNECSNNICENVGNFYFTFRLKLQQNFQLFRLQNTAKSD